jgi:AcrR family transcriptional regulator
MRSIEDDRTTRAVIRDEALRLFAAHGVAAVSLRQIAAAARVSPGLVVHHFGSKEGLRTMVDQHVVATFEAMLGELAGPEASQMFDANATPSVVDAIVSHLPPDSPLPAYLRHLLVGDTDAGRQIFGRLFEASTAAVAAMAQAGLASPGADPPVRAAFLLANDLAVFLLRDRITEVIGTDPLSREGMTRWAGEVLAVYAAGIGSGPAAPGTAKGGPTP